MQMTFFDPLYRFLASIGFTDPLHPALAHMPIGLAAGALVFGFGALILKHPLWKLSAQHCLVLAWLFWFPTVLLGFMDWQHYYGGAWISYIIIKLFLAGFLFLLLSLGSYLVITGRGETKALLVIYLLCFSTVVGLGYCGGRVVFGGLAQRIPTGTKAGKKIFDVHCQACHPNGANSIIPTYPISRSPELKDFNTFQTFIRNPHLANGSKGPMPDFPSSRISETQARELYRYLFNAFAKTGERGTLEQQKPGPP